MLQESLSENSFQVELEKMTIKEKYATVQTADEEERDCSGVGDNKKKTQEETAEEDRIY